MALWQWKTAAWWNGGRSRAKTRRRGTYLLRRRRRGREPPPPVTGGGCARKAPSVLQAGDAQAAKLRSRPAAAKCQTSRRSDRVVNVNGGSETCRGDAGICWRVVGAWWGGDAAPKRGQLARLDMCAAITYRRGRVGATAARSPPSVFGRVGLVGTLPFHHHQRSLSFPSGEAMGSEFRGAATAQPPLHAACFRLGVFSGLLPSSLPRVISLLLPCRVARHRVPLLRGTSAGAHRRNAWSVIHSAWRICAKFRAGSIFTGKRKQEWKKKANRFSKRILTKSWDELGSLPHVHLNTYKQTLLCEWPVYTELHLGASVYTSYLSVRVLQIEVLLSTEKKKQGSRFQLQVPRGYHVGVGKTCMSHACRVVVGKEIGAKTYRPREMDTCGIRAATRRWSPPPCLQSPVQSPSFSTIINLAEHPQEAGIRWPVGSRRLQLCTKCHAACKLPIGTS